jgi:hypothetical protein
MKYHAQAQLDLARMQQQHQLGGGMEPPSFSSQQRDGDDDVGVEVYDDEVDG